MAQSIGILLLGIATGAFSGIVGVGGGVVIVPALVFIFGLSQHHAQGTTLAMLVPPIGILAAWTYYKQGYVDLRIAALLCLGFVLGGLLGAKFAVGLSQKTLQRFFGAVLIAIGVKMLFAGKA